MIIEGDIVVSARRIYEDPWWFRWGLTNSGQGYMYVPGINYSGEIGDFLADVEDDKGAIKVDTTIKRPLEWFEQRAMDDLKSAIAADKAVIQSLPDGQQIRMYDGSIITKEQLLDRYLRLDIRVDDNDWKWDGVHKGYKNGTTRAEVELHPDGDVTLNIMILTLGSGLVDHSQKMTVAARAMAEKKTVGQRS